MLMRQGLMAAALSVAGLAAALPAQAQADAYPNQPVTLVVPCLLYTSPSPRD